MILAIAVLALTISAFFTGRSVPRLQGLYSQKTGLLRKFLRWFVLSVALWIAKTNRRQKRRNNRPDEIRKNSFNAPKESDSSLSFVANDKLGNVVLARIHRAKDALSHVSLWVRLADATFLSYENPTAIIEDSDESADGTYVSAGGLRIQALSTAKSYRIMYSGLMRRQNENQPVEVNIRMWFKSLSDPTSHSIDFSPSMVAESLAVENCPIKQMKRFLTRQNDHFEQSGELKGIIDFDGKKVQLCLNGIRDYDVKVEPRQTNGFFVLRARFAKGLVFSMTAESTQQMSHSVTGFVTFPTGFVYPVTWTDFHLANIADGDKLPKKYKIGLHAHGRVFVLGIEIISERISHKSESVTSGKVLVVHESIVKVVLNGNELGYGMIEFNNKGERTEAVDVTQSEQINILPEPPAEPSDIPFCTQLNDPLCRLTSITGGKASKLADIKVALASEKQPELTVPDGFTVTVAAYKDHVARNAKIADAIQCIIAAVQRLNECSDQDKSVSLKSKLEESCQQFGKIIMELPFSRTLEIELEKNMKVSFGEDWQKTYTAVRSSAIGEDGAEASGAGQMETFLGVRGTEKLVTAIKKCWASNYSFRAIQYRRQLCTSLDPPIAVLIQQLIDPEIAGVLFTRHPDNGSTSRMVINASFGIGEGVVSGEVHPDTVTIRKNNLNDTNSIEIIYDEIGDKSTTYELDEEQDTVHQRSKVQDESCCLWEAEIRRLYEIGNLIERVFSSARDVEFAVKRNDTGKSHFFILQARPITTADMEEEWELLQEFNTPIPSDDEIITTANIQEMMPGAVSPFSATIWHEAISAVIENLTSAMGFRPQRRFRMFRPFPIYYQHMFINYTMMGMNMNSERIKHSVDMGFFGRSLNEVSIERIAEQNDMTAPWFNVMRLFEIIGLVLPRNNLPGLIAEVEAVKIKQSDDPQEILQTIRNLFPLSHNMWLEHIITTGDSSNYTSRIMRMLDPEQTWSPEIHADVSLMLANCGNVYSVDVPLALEEIAEAIKTDKDANELFKKMDRIEAANWLLSADSGHPGELFRSFLKKHGHRCVRESDVREKTWSEEPEKVIDSIKLIITNESRRTDNNAKGDAALTVDDAIESINTPITAVQRIKLKYLLRTARKSVGLRECCKSYGIKVMDYFRQASRLLGKALTKKGLLPDEDLVYFLQLEEIEALLSKRSPKLVAKALRRRKLFPKFQTFKFNEITFGNPEPMTEQIEERVGTGEFIVKGTAVGHNCISGVARVVKSLADANKIKHGDILIVPFTDVGWSPYFPMISGLVTELGGLISHGAVVAREYGLPCIVGCKQATNLIRTGDQVFIDGQASLIKVIPAEE